MSFVWRLRVRCVEVGRMLEVGGSWSMCSRDLSKLPTQGHVDRALWECVLCRFPLTGKSFSVFISCSMCVHSCALCPVSRGLRRTRVLFHRPPFRARLAGVQLDPPVSWAWPRWSTGLSPGHGVVDGVPAAALLSGGNGCAQSVYVDFAQCRAFRSPGLARVNSLRMT